MAPQRTRSTFIFVDIFYVANSFAAALLETRREGSEGRVGLMRKGLVVIL